MIEGHLEKMKTSLIDGKVNYQLPLENNFIALNPIIGQSIKISYRGKIHCMNCGKETKTSFGQGYCFQCFSTIPETDECVLNPEKCKAHLGISRDMEWSKTHCLTDHIVYLAYTGNLKVGVTRHSQIPTRWIDQGAIQAIQLAKTPNRHIAGLIEVFLKSHFADKTSWQQMLKMKPSFLPVNLIYEKEKAIGLMPSALKQFVNDNNDILNIQYPLLQIPDSITSSNFNKTNSIAGKLTGIKGQYLIFDNKNVINIRSHRGYLVSIEI
ncbi:MAG: DUF2797 domain-containing protein [Marinilabiliaceae bacterium]|nr:DUF2797 domain-containing protein [Marinilabiliaceae bacterium]